MSSPEVAAPSVPSTQFGVGTAELLAACEDCVQEIRFHHDALVRSLERRGSLATRLQDLIAQAREVSEPSGTPKPSGSVLMRLGRRSTDAVLGAAGRSTPTGWEGIALSPLTGSLPEDLALRHEEVGTAADFEAVPDARAVDHCTVSSAGASDLCNTGTKARLHVYAFGVCRILQDGVALDGWPQGKGKSLFKYLVLHRRQPVAREVLMQCFWPGADADAARNNLNVAIYGVRKALSRAQPALVHIVLEDGSYRFNPELDIWVDVEHFVSRVLAGREAEAQGRWQDALRAYEEAEQTYRDELLVEEREEEWVAPERTRLRDLAIDTVARMCRLEERQGQLSRCAALCRRQLEIDPCDESVHRDLMSFYNRLGQPHLALRQFQICADALSRGLSMIPSPATTALYRQIQRREAPAA